MCKIRSTLLFFLVVFVSAACEDQKIKRTQTRPSDGGEDFPGFLSEDHVTFLPGAGGRASVGDASATVPTDAVDRESTISIKRINSDEMTEATVAVLGARCW